MCGVEGEMVFTADKLAENFQPLGKKLQGSQRKRNLY
jgi:hypothetical protein